MFQLTFGIGLAAFTLGGLSSRIGDQEDLLPLWAEAVIIGLAFALASTPSRWSMIPRLLMPLPTFLIYLSILTGRSPPMPFGAAFLCAGCYALALTAYTVYLSDRAARGETGRVEQVAEPHANSALRKSFVVAQLDVAIRSSRVYALAAKRCTKFSCMTARGPAVAGEEAFRCRA